MANTISQIPFKETPEQAKKLAEIIAAHKHVYLPPEV